MARVTYGFLAAAAAALISGFFIKGSSFPLLISIALSVAVSALILYGWSRRVRDEDLDVEDEPLEELEVVDESDDLDEAEATTVITRKRPARKPKPDETFDIDQPDDLIDDSLFAPSGKRTTASRPKAKAKPKAKPKAQAKPKAPAKPKSGPNAAKPKSGAARVAVVPGASSYHRPSCRFAKSPNVRMVSTRIAKERGYDACGICKP